MTLQLAYVIPLNTAVSSFAIRLAEEAQAEFGANRALVIEPHITLKTPFEAAILTPFERVLDDLASELSPFEIHITAIHWFEPDVIFLDMIQDTRLDTLRRRLLVALAELGVHPEAVEGEGYHFHITVAWGLPTVAIWQLWKRWQGMPVALTTACAELALVANDGTGWRRVRRQTVDGRQ
ncbi:MAG: 2'-5' RNA ligase family protein [Anaerolineae bacterium]|nr:2'-5' RNA ligase family protein [Anaerolineae bacterium]